MKPYCDSCGRTMPCLSDDCPLKNESAMSHKQSCKTCNPLNADTEESVGFVLVQYYGADTWNNYKFFQKGKFKGYHGNWMDDPIEATVFGNSFAGQAVTDLQLTLEPRFKYKFVPVNVRNTKVVTWKRSYIAQSNTSD